MFIHYQSFMRKISYIEVSVIQLLKKLFNISNFTKYYFDLIIVLTEL